ncbi:MAG: molybdopterin-dependent oxidoreductase [Gammaproteobacteria bacterium]|nr:molybdopterin-dependent oxidoreductase [Gammaproteobacteria bacterium]
MSVDFDRRSFLKGFAALSGALAMPGFVARTAASVLDLTTQAVPEYKDWKDIFRQQWSWDKVVRSTHHLNCWTQAHCAWDVFVKDGLVFREEQAAEYEPVNDELPDFNPRGCQKGGCFSHRMYDDTRITHPLRRVGPRGGGKWERVSWQEALDDIADSYIDVTVEEGTDRTVWDLGPGIDLGVSTAAQGRFSMLTQSIGLDMDGEIGDSRRGTLEMFGKIQFERSADDYFNSDLILFWGGNPIQTQIPQAHFYLEAKYRGARIIAISPDLSPSATKADLWISLDPGTDGALAMGVAHLIVKEKKIDEAFVKEQTDLPLLVRQDTGEFLKQSDLEEGGREDHFLLWDDNTDSLQLAPFRSLKLDELEPRLQVKKTVVLKDGSKVKVRSVFSMLQVRLRPYTPDAVAKMCGVKPAMIRRLTHEITSAKAVSAVAQTTMCKFYHGNLMERAVGMIFCLTGNMGRKGAGFAGFPLLTPDGGDKFQVAPHVDQAKEMFANLEHELFAPRLEAGDTIEMLMYDFGHMLFDPANRPIRLPIWTSGSLFWNIHGGIGEHSADPEVQKKWNLKLKRPIYSYLDECLEKQWQPVFPPKGSDPRILIAMSSNSLRRVRGSQKLLEVLWPKLKKVVVMDWRINSTGRYADYILPVAPWYERTSLKWVTPLSPYLTTTEAATKPMGEAFSDWGVIVLMAKHIQKRARERNTPIVKSPHGVEVNLQNLYDDLTMNGEFNEHNDDKVAKAIYDLSDTHKKQSWEETKKKGFARFEKLPMEPSSIGNMCDFPENDTIVPLTYHIRDKVPWPTATRRIQFYVDHPFYLELDEGLPRYKEAPKMGGDYPLMMTGGKTRWSIHSTWRDHDLMLRLNRPDPAFLMSKSDAKSRGIEDGDWVTVSNDVGEFVARAKVTPSMRPGQTLMFHAWENYQFPSKGDMNSVSPSPLNPVEMAGGHPHLRAGILMGQNSMYDRDTRVEVKKLPRGTQV